MVVPVGAVVKVITTSDDVIHSFAVPAFWIKMDAVPGRLNETWFKVDRPGLYYGQCSELCGARHGYMPIAVEVVTQDAVRPVGRRPMAARCPAPAGGAKPATRRSPPRPRQPPRAGSAPPPPRTDQLRPPRGPARQDELRRES